MPAPLVLPAPSPPAPTTTQGSTFMSVVAAGERRGDMRWLVVGGTCGRTAAWGDGGWWRAHAGGSVCGACGARVCCASAVLGGRCVDVVGVRCWYVTG